MHHCCPCMHSLSMPSLCSHILVPPHSEQQMEEFDPAHCHTHTQDVMPLQDRASCPLYMPRPFKAPPTIRTAPPSPPLPVRESTSFLPVGSPQLCSTIREPKSPPGPAPQPPMSEWAGQEWEESEMEMKESDGEEAEEEEGGGGDSPMPQDTPPTTPPTTSRSQVSERTA